MVSDDFDSAVTHETYQEARKMRLSDTMEHAAHLLRDLLIAGVTFQCSQNPMDRKQATIFLHDKMANVAIRIPIRSEQLSYPGVESYWDMQKEIACLKKALAKADQDIRALKVMVPGSDEVL